MISIGGDPAKGKKAARLAEIEERKNRLTVSELCGRYRRDGTAHKKASTLAIDRGRIDRHIKPLLGSRAVAAITLADVRSFQLEVAEGKTATHQKTKARGVAVVKGGRAGANRVVGLLGAIFEFAVDHQLLTVNPARSVRHFKTADRERFLSERELADLGETLIGFDGPAPNIVRLLLLTGCRRSEITDLRWGNVDFDHAVLRLPDSKTGQRQVRVRPAALQIRDALKPPQVKADQLVFPGRDPDKPFAGLPKVWREITAKAGLANLHIHDLRHAFASVSVASGNTLVITSKLLGHKSTRATGRCAHLHDDPLDRAADIVVDKISRALNAKVAG